MSLTIFCTPPAYPSFVFFLSPIIFLRSSSSVVFFVTLILPPSSFSLPFLSLSGSVLYHLIFIFYNLLYQAFVFSQLANFPAQFFISPTGLNLFQSLFLLCLIFVSNYLQVARLIHVNFLPNFKFGACAEIAHFSMKKSCENRLFVRKSDTHHLQDIISSEFCCNDKKKLPQLPPWYKCRFHTLDRN
jgi:hypothetical protein